MKRVLITGATGNVGSAVLRHLPETALTLLKASYQDPLKDDEVYFNFENLARTKTSLENIDLLFLLRPPHISDTGKYFKPLIEMCREAHVGHIVFLSVQGAEKSSIIPHNKIERLIVESGTPYTFVRPSYFMQNLTSTLKKDIRNGEIFLPAGRAPFLWMDVENIGQAIATIIMNGHEHLNKVYEITGSEYFTFAEVADKLTRILGKKIKYHSPNLVAFTFRKLREGMDLKYAMVLIMLHYLARFQAKPSITSSYHEITGLQPHSLDHFIRDHKTEWQ